MGKEASCPGKTPPITEVLQSFLYVSFLSRHWDMDNREGFCRLCRSVKPAKGNLEHLLLGGGCPALVEARLSMISFFNSYMVPRPHLLHILKACWYDNNDDTTLQFLLDCSVLLTTIMHSQKSEFKIIEELFYMTRSYVFKIHMTQRRLLKNS